MPTPVDRVAGVTALTVSGERLLLKGNLEFNIGKRKREPVVGLDGFHGFKEMPQPPYVSGDFTYHSGLDLEAILEAADETVVLELPNGKDVVFRKAAQTGEGAGNPEEGTVSLRFDAASAEVI